MDRFRNYTIVLLAFLFLIPCADAFAARRKKSNSKRSPVISYVDVYGGAGYSLLMHDIQGSKTPGGGAGILGFGYDLKSRKNPFIMHAGLEFMFLNSMTKMDPFGYKGTFGYTDPVTNVQMDFFADFDKYKESHNRFSVNVPIMVGAQFEKWYFLAGVKAEVGFIGSYKTSAKMETYAVDPELIDPLENMYTHGLQSRDIKNSGSIKFGMQNIGLDVTGSIEAGVVLDEWMPRNMLQLTNRDRTKLSYRAGLFADYGILDISVNPRTNNLFGFENGAPINAAQFHDPNYEGVKPNSLLASNRAENSKLNSLVVGAKFTVLFQVSKDPVKRKRPQPKPKPKPKPQVPLPDPPYLYLAVRDFDTEKPIDANVKMFKTIAPFDTVFVAKTDINTGMATTRLKSQTYGIIITRPGYIEYIDTLPGIYNDTVLIELQPIKENTIVILENLLFDFDKATLQNDSALSLLELEKLMKENPSVEIEITGHTDNKGSQSYNRRLSERRAKTVYDLMVERGVDPKRMSYDGVGSREPLETNDTEEGRAINRRVEFRIIYIDANAVNDTVLEEFSAELETEETEDAEEAEPVTEIETEIEIETEE